MRICDHCGCEDAMMTETSVLLRPGHYPDPEQSIMVRDWCDQCRMELRKQLFKLLHAFNKEKS